MNRKKFLRISTLAVAGLLVGCSKEASTRPQPVSISAIEAGTTGFVAGSRISARTVYVFFDPQCPHCGHLWDAAKPLRNQARFVWIPVNLLTPVSLSQGATLLAAADPVDAMDAHKASLLARTGGISGRDSIDATSKQVEKNTALLSSFGVNSIPYIVGNHAQTGVVVTIEGAVATAVLASRLGLTVPAG